VHVQLVAGGYFAMAVGLWAVAALSLVVQVSGRRSIDYRLFALLSVAIGVYSAALGVAWCYADGLEPARWAMAAGVARVAAVAAVAMHVHFALGYARVGGARAWTLGVYAAAALFEVGLVVTGVGSASGLRTDHVIVLGLDLAYTSARPSPLVWALLVAAPAGQLAACGLFGLSYLRGRREALPLFVGAGVLALTVVNDALAYAGLFRGLQLVPVGFGAMAFAVAVVFVLRYATARADLGRRARELTSRMREVRQFRRELRAIQSELGRKQQLAVMGEMAAVIAHEVRNPLAVIANAVSSLRREAISRHDHDVLLGILDEESARLNRLVSDLLAYARPVAVQRQRVVLHELVQRAALLAAGRADTRVEYDEANVRGQIWADSNLLRQVFDNIVDNAVQAMNGSGTLTIAVKHAARDGVDGFAVSMRDEGEGMDTLVRSRAKDPFFTTRPAGTGLGLAIVSRIVEAHGGDLSIESRAGEGTTVTVFLPVGTESLPPPQPMADTDPGRHTSSIPPAREGAGPSEPPPRLTGTSSEPPPRLTGPSSDPPPRGNGNPTA
jgi:signal transduction histidine kinase